MEFRLNKRLFVLTVLMGLFVSTYSRPILSDSVITKKYRSTFYMKPLDIILRNASAAYQLNIVDKKYFNLNVYIPFTIGINPKYFFRSTRKIWTIGLGFRVYPDKAKKVFILPLLEIGEINYWQPNYGIGDHEYYLKKRANLGIVSMNFGSQMKIAKQRISLETLFGFGIRFQNVEDGSGPSINQGEWEGPFPVYPIIKAGLNIGFNF